ncbi:MAG TPA: tetratricopeptide repeat protein [Anaerolineales bacterium]|nr:tetratricopeptide repeat protein [Anaerolineales bacterium]
MNLSQDRLTFRNRNPVPYRLLVWATLIVAALWVYVQIDRGEIEPLFQPTPTSTRSITSYVQEGQAFFEAGNLDAAVLAFEDAIAVEPDNDHLVAELAQMLVYSSALQTSDAQRAERLQRALEIINEAAESSPRDSYVQAIKVFVLNWNANPNIVDAETRENLLFQAENTAGIAIQLDSNNLLAQVYYAEVLLDQLKWTQASQTIEAVLEKDPQFMDAYRVSGQVLETLGLYLAAVDAYQTALEFSPNMTFLYLYIGYNYRVMALQQGDPTTPTARQFYDLALEAFDRAASINNAIGVPDPLPYLAIAKTYAQQGEFFVASLNAERALEFDPTDANTYGQLGIIYVQARNFETAMSVLKCSTYGCTAEENEVAGVAVTGLPLTSLEVAFYYVQYGSVLSALNFCPQAYPVLSDVENAYGANPELAGIIAENRNICAILQGTQN